jgi:hypothetical protein
MPRFVEVFDIKLNCDLLVNLDAIKYISKRSKEHGGETLVHLGSESTYFILGPEAFWVAEGFAVSRWVDQAGPSWGTS